MDKNAKKSKYKLRAFVLVEEVRKKKLEVGNDALFAEMAGLNRATIYRILKKPDKITLGTANKLRINLGIDKEL